MSCTTFGSTRRAEPENEFGSGAAEMTTFTAGITFDSIGGDRFGANVTGGSNKSLIMGRV